MSHLDYIDPRQDPRWDQFVEAHPHGLICHLSGWREVLERSFSHIKGYFPVLTDPANGTIRAGLPVYLVSSPLTGRRLVSVPFATLSDPLVSSKTESDRLLNAVTRLATHIRASHIEIRALAAAHLLNNSGYARTDSFRNHFLLLNDSPELLKKRFHRTSVRPIVRRSEVNGLELDLDNRDENLQSFYILYTKTRKKLGLPPQPFRFFRNLREVFGPSGKVRLFHASYRGKPAGALLVFQFKNRVSAEFIGLDPEFKHLYPGHFLFWEAIKCSCRKGFELFDFGRTSVHNSSLMQFKKRWGTTEADLPQFWFPSKGKSSSERVEASLGYRVVRDMLRKAPERLLSVLGELCYRHMG